MVDTDVYLHRLVNQIRDNVNQISGQVERVSGQVQDVQADQRRTSSDLQQLFTEFRAFVHKSELARTRHLAETRVGNVRGRIDQQFRHYGDVRRTTLGTLQAFDAGLVSEDTVRNVTEELMLRTPRYWLTPALIALAAWFRNEPDRCAEAVEEAYQRSPTRTALLFALVLRRQGRHQSAVRWLHHYLRGQNADALQREFTVVLECVSQGAFGPAGREVLRETLDGWSERLLTDEDKRRAQVDRWRQEIDSLGAGEPGGYPRLAAISPQWSQLADVLARARTHRALLEKYERILALTPEPGARLEDTVDDILEQLVTEFDDEELPLRRELAFNQAVVDHEGDEELARRETEAHAAALEETADYLTMQSTVALSPQSVGASPATQQLAVAACREWFGQAHAAFSRDYRAAVPSSVEVSVTGGDTLRHGTKKFTMAPWRGSFSTPQQELERSLTAHWNRSIQNYVDALAFKPGLQGWALGGTVVLILIVFMGVSPAFAVIAALIVGGVWGAVMYSSAGASRTAQDQARATLGKRRQASLADLRGAAAEFVDWEQEYRKADADAERVRALIDDLATATTAAAPFEGRVVTVNEGGTRA